MDSSSELDDLRQALYQKDEYIKFLQSLVMKHQIEHTKLKNMCKSQQEKAAQHSEEMDTLQETFQESVAQNLQLKFGNAALLKDQDYLLTEANDMVELKNIAEERVRNLKTQLRQVLGSTPSSSLAIVVAETMGNNPGQSTQSQHVSTPDQIIFERTTPTTGNETSGVRSRALPRGLEGTEDTSNEEEQPCTSTRAAHQNGGKRKPYSRRGK